MIHNEAAPDEQTNTDTYNYLTPNPQTQPKPQGVRRVAAPHEQTSTTPHTRQEPTPFSLAAT